MRAVLLSALFVLALGCGDDGGVTVEKIGKAGGEKAADGSTTSREPRAGPALPAGHPPIDGPIVPAPPIGSGARSGTGTGTVTVEETDGHAEMPLKKTGQNSAEELARALAAQPNEEARRHFERGYRHAFRADLTAVQRHFGIAETELRRAIELDPGFAEAHRALGYAVFNRGGNAAAAMPHYEKAVELKPGYGEAHYAIAFLLGMSDRRRGAEHFKKAMQLGVPDERDLRTKFYPHVE